MVSLYWVISKLKFLSRLVGVFGTCKIQDSHQLVKWKRFFQCFYRNNFINNRIIFHFVHIYVNDEWFCDNWYEQDHQLPTFVVFYFYKVKQYLSFYARQVVSANTIFVQSTVKRGESDQNFYTNNVLKTYHKKLSMFGI